ncbi:DUF2076 domain-containing protein [Larsenimonas rhizosphaerae]|uniref:DUF2076 domain-containing protein n=1 Tax=Larsenimonas rhizosphaerae TaxID=2944682 RepID=A0AA42CUW5_9GAMM|nr:DUF2076 domain-containing protein [Larsenimonas rhizosphaerae]MCX2524391.1 DUF2076 domain-containing protein [Larsenimonas rhizosphaerae]
MSNDANRFIDGLFDRLKTAEEKSGERDTDAEQRIQQHVEAQPAAPYYMAQTIIMQEAALKRLQQKVEALEKKQAEQPAGGGGFLAGLFGGGSNADAAPASRSGSGRDRVPGTGGGNAGMAPGFGARNSQPSGYGGSPMGGSRGGGFMSGALQTAAGVAGGLMLGNLMMDMFHDDKPEDVANTLDDNDTGSDMSDPGAEDMGGDMNNDMGQPDFADNGGMDDPSRYDDGGFDDGGGFDDFGGGFDDV